jgi:hypothetical protein
LTKIKYTKTRGAKATLNKGILSIAQEVLAQLSRRSCKTPDRQALVRALFLTNGLDRNSVEQGIHKDMPHITPKTPKS